MEQCDENFVIVGAQNPNHSIPPPKTNAWNRRQTKPILSFIVLTFIILGCLFAETLMNHDPAGFYLQHLNEAPNREFYFGTDALGRDIFSIIWSGGRISLCIGLLSTAILTVLGIVYGCISGTTSRWIDQCMMRIAELFSSVPHFLLILMLLAILGEPTVLSISIVIGLTNWMNLARIVRSEVRQIQSSEYILAARSFGTPFGRILCKHLLPNFISAIMFIVVSSISSSILMESTLSFLGLGLPIEIISWGSMLTLSNQALLTNAWWVIIIPGAFIVITLLCITNIGHYLRNETNKKSSNL